MRLRAASSARVAAHARFMVHLAAGDITYIYIYICRVQKYITVVEIAHIYLEAYDEYKFHHACVHLNIYNIYDVHIFCVYMHDTCTLSLQSFRSARSDSQDRSYSRESHRNAGFWRLSIGLIYTTIIDSYVPIYITYEKLPSREHFTSRQNFGHGTQSIILKYSDL